MRPSGRLPWRIDVEAIRHDLGSLRPDDWVPHFNTGYYEGDWSGAALRSVDGVAGRLYPDPSDDIEYRDTELLARCPNVRAALAAFGCPLLAARFLRLGAGARIREHSDLNLGFEDGEVRLHVPIVTNGDVAFLLDGRRIDMIAGDVWYLDLNRRHAVVNDSDEDRIHLVIDCVVDPWLDSILRPLLTDHAHVANEGAATPKGLA